MVLALGNRSGTCRLCPWQLMPLPTSGGAIVGIGEEGSPTELADFWAKGDTRPTHLKEAEALLLTLRAVRDRIAGHRMDAFVDNMAVVCAWGKQGCRDMELERLLKHVFVLVTSHNVDLHLAYIKSGDQSS